MRCDEFYHVAFAGFLLAVANAKDVRREVEEFHSYVPGTIGPEEYILHYSSHECDCGARTWEKAGFHQMDSVGQLRLRLAALEVEGHLGQIRA